MTSIRDAETLPPSPKPVRPASIPPGRAQQWAIVIVAVLGAGGAPALVTSLRGDGGQAAATASLAGQVAELRGAVARLEQQGAATALQLAELTTTVRRYRSMVT